jgi:hypothetical protein
MFPESLLHALHAGGHLFEKYVFNDWNALGFLAVLFLIDTALGMGRSFSQSRFHSRGMRQMFRKLIEYSAGIIIGHVFCGIEIDGAQIGFVKVGGPFFKWVIYVFIMIIEVKSIDENMRLWWGGGLPLPKFLRRGMQDWEETGQFMSKTAPAAEITPAAPQARITESPIEEGVVQ